MANVIDTPDLAIACIRELCLPPMFMDIWDGKLHGDLAIHWRRPRTYFRLCHDLVERVSGLEGLCPLWEENGDTITGVLPDERYVSFFYENAGEDEEDEFDPNNEIRDLGHNYQQFVTSQLLSFSESGLDDTLELAARLLEYRHLSELRALLDAYDDETGDADLDRFRLSLK